MYLKKIDLLGFKSFTDKTHIQLEPGISCIVGPNGSGKSNIADALRWVFGEQSAKTLRGGKLEDVIFAGSKKRRALGMAEVSITLDNSDNYLAQPFSEVVVTRRAYRSGQSEYLINNKQCRLKDIHELFVDSGMGLEGISLIGQDRIMEIINAKPDERRLLVEETAGLLKYRHRKKEAGRKLEQTERHLERVGDIISELSIRLVPLEEQAAIATKYLELSEQADRLEIALAVQTLSEVAERLDKYKQQLSQAEQDCLATETVHLQTEGKLEAVNLSINNLDREAAELQQQFYDFSTQRDALQSHLQVLETKEASTKQNQERLEKELVELTTLRENQSLEVENLRQRMVVLGAEVSEQEHLIASGESDEQQRRQSIAAVEVQLQEAKDQAFRLAENLAEQRNQVRYQEQLLGNNKQAIGRLHTQESELQRLLAGQEQQRAALDTRQKSLYAQRAAKEQALQEAQAVLQQLNEQLQHLMDVESDCRYRQHALLSRLKVLEDMAKNYEGFYPGVKSVLLAKKQGKKELNGVIDAMATLLTVPQRYQQAIESFLAGSLQNLVTHTERDAKKAIAYLKATGGGRATFLPLDTLRARERADFSQTKKLKGVYGRASELVEYPDDIKPAVSFLLNNVLVVEDLEVASEAAKALNYRYHIVTLDGDLLSPGGTLSGGSKQKKGGDLLGKKTALLAARRDITTLEQELATAEAKVSKKRRQMQEQEQLLQGVSLEIKELSQAFYDLQREQEQLDLTVAMQNKQLSTIRAELEELLIDNDTIGDIIMEVQEGLTEQEQAYDELVQNIDQLQLELNEKRSASDSGQQDMTLVRVETARLKQELQHLQATEQQLAQAVEDHGWELEEKAADLDLITKELVALSLQKAQTQEQQLALAKEALAKESALNEKRHGAAAEMALAQELQQVAKEQAKRMEELRETCHQLELKKTRLEAEWLSEEQKLAEKFQLTFAEAKSQKQPLLSRREMAGQLKQQRAEIAALGLVNVAAIAELQEVSERYDFLTGQRDDLLAAMDSLQKIIKDMDHLLSTKFSTALERLSAEFGRAFTRLFNGGTASLVMNQPDNLLETGVEMTVQPPGKKVVNYNLLSGGEKALVGLAFLFAVLAVRTTPFCVMDEVDAALDEVNVDRFAEYLQDLADKTQFLLISHRQGTMEAAASLWGVTMQEDGVSKLISVRLEAEQKMA